MMTARRRIAPIAALGTLVLACTLGTASAQVAPVPFGCTSDAFAVQGADTQLVRIDQSVDPFAFGNVGPKLTTQINGLGFRRSDGLLYGYEYETDELVQIDSTGAVFGLGLPPGLPIANYGIGEVSVDGTTMYLQKASAAGTEPLQIIDLVLGITNG
jgi:hypothetical protein